MCDQCGKRFKLKSTLTMHRKIHSQVRPYKCLKCTKAFYILKDLVRHNLIHLGKDFFLKSITVCTTLS